jgi:hypothetical protein
LDLEGMVSSTGSKSMCTKFDVLTLIVYCQSCLQVFLFYQNMPRPSSLTLKKQYASNFHHGDKIYKFVRSCGLQFPAYNVFLQWYCSPDHWPLTLKNKRHPLLCVRNMCTKFDYHSPIISVCILPTRSGHMYTHTTLYHNNMPCLWKSYRQKDRQTRGNNKALVTLLEYKSLPVSKARYPLVWIFLVNFFF